MNTLDLGKFVNRVISIPVVGEDKVASSEEVRLIRKYFGEIVSLQSDFPGCAIGPFFDPDAIAGRLLEDQQLAEIEVLASMVRQTNSYVRQLCVDAIKWAYYSYYSILPSCKYPDLYEPLLRIFEMGYSIRIHHGELIVGKQAIPLSTWRHGSKI